MGGGLQSHFQVCREHIEICRQETCRWACWRNNWCFVTGLAVGSLKHTPVQQAVLCTLCVGFSALCFQKYGSCRP
jgi:hypothetical protein